MTTPLRHIAVITGDPRLPDSTKRNGHYNPEDIATYEAMKAAFRSLDGYAFRFLDDHGTLLEQLRNEPPDLAVNFCDTGFRNVPARELNIPAYLELLDIPYTGAPPAAMVLCSDKAVVRLVAGAHGVAVPHEHFLEADAPLDALPDLFPALIKPNTADGSVGITKDAVVRSRAEAKKYLTWLRETLPGQDALLQEYLPGPEYSVGVIGNLETELCLLPPLEADFSKLPPGLSPILSFESKAIPDSPYWTDINYRRASLAEPLESVLGRTVHLLFRRLGLRDYARFDFRLAADGRPTLLEVNPNPAWANDGKLALMAGFAGSEYREMLQMILRAAITRLARVA